MKKTILRTLFLLGCLALMLGLVSCRDKDSSEEVPAGYMIASCEGDDFRLYVPTDWNLNTAYGVAGAYYNLTRLSVVNTVKYTLNDGEVEALGEDPLTGFYQTRCLPAIQTTANAGSVTPEAEPVATTLDLMNAKRFCTTATVGELSVHYFQVIGKTGNSFYVFTYTAEDAIYENCLPAVDKMLEEFILSSPYEKDRFERKIDASADAPDGMKLASDKSVAYCFYVPESWTLDANQKVYAAWAEDRSSVSVIPKMPANDQTAAEYIDELVDSLNAVGLQNLSFTRCDDAITLGGREAKACEYTFGVEGTSYHVRQTVAEYKGMIYCLTYTATEANYAVHLAEYDSVLSAFTFR